MLHAVIMAGGTGTRFWPESRAKRPKQLLSMVDQRTMIRSTVDRLGGLVPPERVLVATTAELAGQIADELSELPRQAILAEPCKRNTAPCIGLAALRVSRDDPEAIMAVMPADHVIRAEDKFRHAVLQAELLVREQPGRIITFGIRPTYPAESFGYIERGEQVTSKDLGAPVYQVEQFREKPNAQLAQQYVDSGRFYWNSGIFVWRAQTILDALSRFQPEMYEHLQRIVDAVDTPHFGDVLQCEFSAIKGVSIDYAVMEHAKDVVVVEAPFDWDDLGSWQSLARLRGTDQLGNTIIGKHLGIDTTGTIVRCSDDHLVATVGMKDCIIVHTPDATLVANKADEESIRRIVELLSQQGLDEYL
jgi:mannose-1-phosphate guanylyltransferase